MTGAIPTALQARMVPDQSLILFSLTTFRVLLPQASNGQWYRMNDHEVHPSNIKVVLNQQAYVLFYLR